MSVKKRLEIFFGGLAIAVIGIAATMAASWLWSTNSSGAAILQPTAENFFSSALAVVLWVVGPVSVFFGLGRIVSAVSSEASTPVEQSRKAARSYRARLALPIALFIGFPVVYRWSSLFTTDGEMRRWVTFGLIAIVCAAWIAWVYRPPHPDLGKVANSNIPRQSMPPSQKAYVPEEQSGLGDPKRIAQVILASALAAAFGWMVFDTIVSR
jgi:amino acid transporter